jgi:hypothetical protein
MFAVALARAPACFVEARRVARRVEMATFDKPPIFIVGHWRSGTTFLHNLMSLDPKFCFPTITDVLRPYDFYPSPIEFVSRRILLRSLPATRPMDDVPLNPHLPQEEEIALATMAAPSFFNCLYFPLAISAIFAAEVLFDGVTDEAIRSWREAMRYFLSKLAALNPGRRLLLKNPANSARVEHLRALFPGAKFIHIHRHPFAVFQSTQRLYRSMLPLLALQDYDAGIIDEHILWAYPEVMHRLLDGLDRLPATEVATLRFDDFLADPLVSIERIYRQLDLGDFANVRPRIQAAVSETLREPAFNLDVDEATAGRLALRWGTVSDRLGYRLRSPP